MINGLALCAGAGGLELGIKLALGDAYRTIAYCENEATAAAVLVARMQEKRLDDAPLWDDLRSFPGELFRGKVHFISGGYPCQPFSNAGRRLGSDDPRHLWPEVERIIGEVQPEIAFFENVGAHLRLGFYEVARSLQGMGYRVAAVLLTAEEVGAPHGRERLFILAHRDGGLGGWPAAGPDEAPYQRPQLADTERSSGSTEPRQQHQERAEVATRTGAAVADASSIPGQVPQAGQSDCACGGTTARSSGECDCAGVGDTNVPRLEGWLQPFFRSADIEFAWPPGPSDSDAWRRILAERPDLAPATEPEVRAGSNGVAAGLVRSDQLHILGNGVVPQQAAYALTMLLDALND